MPTTERVCLVMRLRPDRIDDYLTAHEHIWPEMLDALERTGWRNYSLFLHPAEHVVVGYLETDDYARAVTDLAATDVNTRWQAHMSEFFLPPDTDTPTPDAAPTTALRLDEYFHLD